MEKEKKIWKKEVQFQIELLEKVVETVKKMKSLKYDKPRKKMVLPVKKIIERQKEWADTYNQAIDDVAKMLKDVIKELKN